MGRKRLTDASESPLISANLARSRPPTAAKKAASSCCDRIASWDSNEARLKSESPRMVSARLKITNPARTKPSSRGARRRADILRAMAASPVVEVDGGRELDALAARGAYL